MTFLFSDIEGSTVRWEHDRAAMGPAVARHDALMRQTLEARGGYIFKTVGDAFCAAFATAPDAIAAALDAQRALASEDFAAVEGIRVRMALHTGRSDERDGDYFGPAVNRVARLLAIGYGGQVLVSRTAADLLQGEMPPKCSLCDRGSHRLKDLGQPEHVFQLIAPALRENFPALRSLDNRANNLPAQLTSFVGRETELADITGLLEQHRFVTLVGPGGAGKTRCAVQAGAELLDGFADGVWLVELAPISDLSLVAHTIAHALNVAEQPPRRMLDTLFAHLENKRLLLILDNCEHVISEARAITAAILQSCREVRILATSREGLNVAGEQFYSMPSLSVPPVDAPISAQALLSFGAAHLFADRALSADNRFTLTDADAPHVAEICRRLDGIPLAIELAAARVKVLAPQRLAQMLDARFRVLTGGDRNALPRHQTMRALIDWSYDLLSEEERTLFRKLSIFAGSFALESASAACSYGQVDEIATLGLLSSLVDKSLVHWEPVTIGKRYRLLESTRQYARERLIESGQYDATARAHAAAFVALAEELDRSAETMSDREWFARAELDIENFRSALGWAFGERGDALLGQRLAVLRPLWVVFGASEGRRWTQIARDLVRAETPASVVAAIDLAEAHVSATLLQYKNAYAAAERALARYRGLGDPMRTADAQLLLGSSLVFLGKIAEGESIMSQALAGARAIGAQRLASLVLNQSAMARSAAGDAAGARQLYSEALAIARERGAERSVALAAMNLAEAEHGGGDPAAALRSASEALAIFRRFSEKSDIASVLSNIAAYLVALGRYKKARATAQEALATARDARHETYALFALQHLAAVGALQQKSGAQSRRARVYAAHVLGFVEARLETLREYTEEREYDALLAALRDALGADELSKLMEEGGAWSEARAVAEAMRI